MQWKELRRASSDGRASEQAAIDIDALDGILMNRAQAQAVAQCAAVDTTRATADRSSTGPAVVVREADVVPTRPARPKSSGAMVASLRTTAFTTRTSRACLAHTEPADDANVESSGTAAAERPSTGARRIRIRRSSQESLIGSASQSLQSRPAESCPPTTTVLATPRDKRLELSSGSEFTATTTDTELSADEWRVLQETLLKCG